TSCGRSAGTARPAARAANRRAPAAGFRDAQRPGTRTASRDRSRRGSGASASFDKLNASFLMVDHQAVQGVLAANLRRLRIAPHLSLSELARATTISKATLSSIETGRANPTVETLAGLAGALRVSISELLEELPLGEIRIVRGAQARAGQLDGIAQRAL